MVKKIISLLTIVFLSSCSVSQMKKDNINKILKENRLGIGSPKDEVISVFEEAEYLASKKDFEIYSIKYNALLVFKGGVLNSIKFITSANLNSIRIEQYKTPYDLMYNLGYPDYIIGGSEGYSLGWDIYNLNSIDSALFYIKNNSIEANLYLREGISYPLSVNPSECRSSENEFVNKIAEINPKKKIKDSFGVEFVDNKGDLYKRYCNSEGLVKLVYPIDSAISDCQKNNIGACWYLSKASVDQNIKLLSLYKYCTLYSSVNGKYPLESNPYSCEDLIDRDKSGLMRKMKAKEAALHKEHLMKEKKKEQEAKRVCGIQKEYCHVLIMSFFKNGNLEISKKYAELNCAEGFENSCKIDAIIQRKISEKNRVKAENRLFRLQQERNNISYERYSRERYLEYQNQVKKIFEKRKVPQPQVIDKSINCATRISGSRLYTNCY